MRRVLCVHVRVCVCVCERERRVGSGDWWPGVCVAWGVCGLGCVWLWVCVALGVCGLGCVWPGVCVVLSLKKSKPWRKTCPPKGESALAASESIYLWGRGTRDDMLSIWAVRRGGDGGKWCRRG